MHNSTATPFSPIMLAEQYLLGETVLVLGDTTLVMSQSTPGSWYVVTNGACTCPSFHYRAKCRHTAAAAQAVAPVVPEPAVCTPAPVRNDGSHLFAGRSILAAFADEEDEHGHASPPAPLAKVAYS